MPTTDYDRVVLKDHALVEMLSQPPKQFLLLAIRDTTLNTSQNARLTLEETEELIKKLQSQVELLKNNK